MNKNRDFMANFGDVLIIHQKIPSHEVGRHSHEEHEFFMPIQGDISVQYDQVRVSAGPGRMLYVPPNLDHSFSSTAQGSGERIIVLVSDKFWKKHSWRKFRPVTFPSSSLAKELFFHLLIHPNANGKKYFLEAMVQNLSESLEGSTNRLDENSRNQLEGKVQDDRIKMALQQINQSFGTLSFQEVARNSGLSLRNFNRLFLKEVGMTPKNYSLAVKIDKAKNLLMTTQMTVTDITLEVGYNSLSKFIDTFKKTEGILPTDYRLQRKS